VLRRANSLALRTSESHSPRVQVRAEGTRGKARGVTGDMWLVAPLHASGAPAFKEVCTAIKELEAALVTLT
jgi:hypothetical protein